LSSKIRRPRKLKIRDSDIEFVFCTQKDPLYRAFRDRHYVENNGTIGQQIHYLILYQNDICGIISGASAVYAVKARDEFFGITKENRSIALSSIINNVVFRLEANIPNLASKILKLWRKQISADWEKLYNVRAHGFETFVGSQYQGSIYKADNWIQLGKTWGSSKRSKGDTYQKINTEQKTIFCYRIPKTNLASQYQSFWDDSSRSHELALTRDRMIKYSKLRIGALKSKDLREFLMTQN